MSELIRREDAIEIVIRTCGDYATAFSEICKLPAVDAVEVVRCRECEFSRELEKYEFCPNCGAKMDGKEDEE